MPLYEFECPICGRRTTLQRAVRDYDAPGPYCFDLSLPKIEKVKYDAKHKVIKMVRVVSRFTPIVKNGTRR